MFDDVVVFAHNYPYWVGPTAETYLEGEMNVISRCTKRLHVVAFEDLWETAPLRDCLPPNLNVVTLFDWDRPLVESGKRRLYQIRTLFRSEFVSDAHRIKDLDKLLAYTYFIRLSDRIARLTWDRLRDSCPEFGSGKTLLYSFWFNEPARAVALIAKKMASCGMSKPAMIARAHGYDCYDYRSDVGYLPCKTWMASQLDKVYPCSRDGVRYLQERNPKVEDKFEVMHLGTKDFGLGPSPDLKGSVRIVTCSRLVPLKRVDLVLDALAELMRRGVPFSWTCVGDGECLPSLKEKAKLYGLEPFIDFKGALPQREVRFHYQNEPFDAILNVSQFEGIPLSLMEAFSAGVPAIATNVGGNSEIVQDGVNGKLIPLDFSAEELADAILEVAQVGSRQFRDGARKTWEEEYSLERNASRLMEDAEGYL